MQRPGVRMQPHINLRIAEAAPAIKLTDRSSSADRLTLSGVVAPHCRAGCGPYRAFSANDQALV